jgi:glutathione S-transferase
LAKPTLYGADYSVYVRIARLALLEKGVAHELVPVDIFAADGVPAWYRELHPFARIPAFEHDGFRLYETAAITRYIDEAFEGPALQPDEPRLRARMVQIVAMLDAYAYRPMVWHVAVERLEKKTPNEALVMGGLTAADVALSALSALKQPGTWLLGDALTLADLHAAAIIGYFVKVPAGDEMIAAFPDIASWWERVAARPSFVATQRRS